MSVQFFEDVVFWKIFIIVHVVSRLQMCIPPVLIGDVIDVSMEVLACLTSPENTIPVSNCWVTTKAKRKWCKHHKI